MLSGDVERECSDPPKPVIPTEADRRECDELRSGGTLCFSVRRTRVEIDSE